MANIWSTVSGQAIYQKQKTQNSSLLYLLFAYSSRVACGTPFSPVPFRWSSVQSRRQQLIDNSRYLSGARSRWERRDGRPSHALANFSADADCRRWLRAAAAAASARYHESASCGSSENPEQLAQEQIRLTSATRPVSTAQIKSTRPN